MGYSVGRDHNRRRHIGYGVPATCDHPECGAEIDRGMGYACGSGVEDNCGLFFCIQHGGGSTCERCKTGAEPFEPTPDTVAWAEHVLTDPSWAEWRAQETSWAEDMRAILEGAPS